MRAVALALALLVGFGSSAFAKDDVLVKLRDEAPAKKPAAKATAKPVAKPPARAAKRKPARKAVAKSKPKAKPKPKKTESDLRPMP